MTSEHTSQVRVCTVDEWQGLGPAPEWTEPDDWDECDLAPNRRAGIAYLNRDGDLRVPCSRFGSSTFECSPVAWRLAFLLARETDGGNPTYAELDYAMGLVVNDHDDVAYIIRNYGHGHYQ